MCVCAVLCSAPPPIHYNPHTRPTPTDLTPWVIRYLPESHPPIITLFYIIFHFPLSFSKHAKRHPYFDAEVLRQRWGPPEGGGGGGSGGELTDRGSHSTGVNTDGSEGLASP